MESGTACALRHRADTDTGAILVYSEPEHGTTFKIYLPRVQEAPAAGEPRAQPSPSRGSETVLVVEDDDAIRTLICEVLEKLGYAIHKAGSGAEALQLCEQYPGRIDLVISDVVMPSMGGMTTSQITRSILPG